MLHLVTSASRRRFLRDLAFGTAFATSPGAFAEALSLTPKMTEGPFYPDALPLDTDNDLILINDGTTPGVGEVTHLTGRVMTAAGTPLRNAVVEIWQCDSAGAYLHSKSGNRERRDSHFQGFGRFLTDSSGHYYFRTIKPVPYPGRAPHIHVAVNHRGKRVLTTQLLVSGLAENETDGVFKNITDPAARRSVLVDFTPLPGVATSELQANFDIVVGITPEAH